MSDALLIFLSSTTFLSFLGSVLILLAGRREGKARTENMKQETKNIKQDLADKATESNGELFDRLQKERNDNEKVFKRLSEDIKNLQNDLRTSNDARTAEIVRNVNTEDELRKYKNAYAEALVKLNIHDEEIAKIKKKTGQLLDRDQLKTGVGL